MTWFLLKMLKDIRYLGLSLLFVILMLLFYPALQVSLQGLNNFWFWFTLLPPSGWFLYLLYGILFGVTLAFFIWQRAQKVCLPIEMVKGGFLGTLGGFFGTAAAVCPACLPWLGLLLPVGAATSLLKYSPLIMTASIILLLLALWILGGFKRSV